MRNSVVYVEILCYLINAQLFILIVEKMNKIRMLLILYSINLIILDDLFYLELDTIVVLME